MNERRSSQATGKDLINASKHISSEADSEEVALQVPKVRMPPRHKSSNNLLETTNEVPVSTFKQRKLQKDRIHDKPLESSLTPLNMQEGVPATPTAKQSSPLVFRHESHFGRKKKRQF